MSGLKFEGNARFRTMVRGVFRWGTLCGVFATLMFATGCPVVTTPCETDADCTDDVWCNGDETCDAENADADNTGCVAGTAPCTADQVCDEDADTCNDVCTDDTDCADADACNGNETCVDGACSAGTALNCEDDDNCTTDSCDAAAGCVHDVVDCDPGEECNPDSGICEALPCDTDDECDDADVCNGTETCVDGACVAGTALNCDDSDLCTTDACDATDGCSNTAVECADGETCEAATGNCVAVTAETFTVTADASATQAEGDSGTTNFTFTVTRAGGTAAHTVDYAVTGGAGTGDAASDDFVGGAFPSGTVVYAAAENGDKTITIAVAGDTNVELEETFTLTVTDPDDADAVLGTATGTIQNDDSSANPTFTVPTGTGATVGQNSLIAGVSVADADNSTLTVDITTSDGFISFNAVPAATAVDGAGNAVTTANVLKTAYVLTGTITNINTTLSGLQFTSDRSSGNPGTDQVTFTGTDADGGTGTGTLSIAVGIQISLTANSDTGAGFTGTPGGDVFLATTPTFWGQGDVLAGGDGPDMIEIRAAAGATYPDNHVAAFGSTGIETIWISSTTGAPIIDNLGDVSGLDTITYWPSGAHNLTIDDAPDGVTVNVRTDNGAFGAAVDVDIKDATFGSQSFTVNILGDSTNACEITTLNNGNADVESVTLFSGSRDGTTPVAPGNSLSTGAGANIALTTLNITGDRNLDIGAWADGKVANISASGFTGNLTTSGAGYAETSGSILGGDGDDVLLCGANAQAINGGPGSDTITGAGGADQCTGGTGNDTFAYLIAEVTANADTITDFGVSGTDVIDWTDVVLANLRGTGADYQEAAAASALSANTGLFVQTTAMADLATATALTAANNLTGVAIGDIIYLVAGTATDTAIYLITEAGVDTTFDTAELVATLTDVDTTERTAFSAANFADFQ